MRVPNSLGSGDNVCPSACLKLRSSLSTAKRIYPYITQVILIDLSRKTECDRVLLEYLSITICHFQQQEHCHTKYQKKKNGFELQMDIIDLKKTCPPTVQEDTFFPTTHRTFSSMYYFYSIKKVLTNVTQLKSHEVLFSAK